MEAPITAVVGSAELRVPGDVLLRPADDRASFRLRLRRIDGGKRTRRRRVRRHGDCALRGGAAPSSRGHTIQLHENEDMLMHFRETQDCRDERRHYRSRTVKRPFTGGGAGAARSDRNLEPAYRPRMSVETQDAAGFTIARDQSRRKAWMKITHRIGLNATPTLVAALGRLGIPIPVDSGFAVFDIDEDSLVWPAVSEIVAAHRLSDVPHTSFDATEVAGSEHLALLPTWHHGYPQPDDDFRYREITYNLDDFCEECGIGLTQKAPFRFKREPRWGRNGIMQLNWVFDEFFVTPELYEEAFRPLGIAAMPVFDTKERELTSVVQLVASTRSPLRI